MAQQYDNSSIKALKGADRIRKRPEVMLTTKKLEGAQNTINEMVGNALDEAGAGYGDTIDITYHKDHSVSVRDYGRGVPLGWNEEEQRWNWDLIYNEMYAGGKYIEEDISEEIYNKINVNDIGTLTNFVYLFPIGTNGLGGFATQASSEFFEVCSYHNESHGIESTKMVRSRMRFTKGIPDFDELEISETTEKRGTLVHWKPDTVEVFTEANTDDLDFDWMLDMYREIAYVKGYTFNLTNESTGEKHSIVGKGLQELLKLRCGKSITEENVYYKEQWQKNILPSGVRYLAKAEVALAFTTKHIKNMCYHNSSRMQRGVTYIAITDAVSRFFTERGREASVKIRESDYIDLVSCVVSTYSTTSSYETQSKVAVQNGFLERMVYDIVYNILTVEFGKGNKMLKEIVKNVIDNAVTRQKIQEFEKQQKAASKAVRGKKVDKYYECKFTGSYPPELWIPEGDSAANALLDSRNGDFQSVLPIRGKILNCLKASMDKILVNTLIISIFQVLGCGMDLKGTDLFNIKNLKYDKIIFATDADEDGYQIRVLLFLVFYVLAPELLRQNKVYIAETPLFENKLIGGSSVFAYNKAEQEQLKNTYGSRITSTHRSKGLGENNEDMMWDTTLNPETRRLVPLVVDSNDAMTRELIDCLFGNDKFKNRKSVLLSTIGIGLQDLVDTVDIADEIDLGEGEDE